MPKSSKDRRMSSGQAPVAGVDAIADAPAKPRQPTDKSRLGALRSRKRAEAKKLMSRSPRTKPWPRKAG